MKLLSAGLSPLICFMAMQYVYIGTLLRYATLITEKKIGFVYRLSSLVKEAMYWMHKINEVIYIFCCTACNNRAVSYRQWQFCYAKDVSIGTVNIIKEITLFVRIKLYVINSEELLLV